MLSTLSKLILGAVIARRPKADAAISNLLEHRRLPRCSAPRNDICSLNIIRLRRVALKLCAFVLLTSVNPASAEQTKEAKLWEPVEWNFENPGHASNPFDLVAKATVDTRSQYKEIELTDLKAESAQRFNAPHRSDWAVAVEADTSHRSEYGKVELLRDKWGVPHVFADSDAGAMYGSCYAAAEDRAFQMYYNLRIIQGRLAELIGDEKVGVTPQDIIDYKLPTHPLKDVDIKRATDALKNDPFVQHFKPWQDAINQLLEMKVRAEQQAFAVHDLNYVISHYLPEKLDSPKKFLP